jgi:hypothetical protein
MRKAVLHVASTAAGKDSTPQISSTSTPRQDLRQAFAALHQAGVSSRPDIRREGASLPFTSDFPFFFTEYNARRRRASGMLVASFEADIMRKSSNQSV